jgi:hypothetical protein
MYHQHNKRVGKRPSCAPHPLEISRPGQAEFALHPYLEMPTVLVASKHYNGGKDSALQAIPAGDPTTAPF